MDEKGKIVKENGRPKMQALEYTLRQPPRLKFTLEKVDQYFFDPLIEILGKEYVDRFPYARFIAPKESGPAFSSQNHYPEILKVMEHNPVLIFQLRKGVRFHDGHEFDSGDVLFTYQVHHEPRNASPRTSDYEPVKSAEVLGKYKIKFIYKRLFSPAINAWMMGMLPEHLLNAEALQREARTKTSVKNKLKALICATAISIAIPLAPGRLFLRSGKATSLSGWSGTKITGKVRPNTANMSCVSSPSL